MTTNKLRRDLETLKARRGLSDCPACGYPSYANVEYKVVMKIRSYGDPEPPPKPPTFCDVCGHKHRDLTIRMKGLQEKPRGDADYPSD
jgi:hypothetical protein